MAGNCVALGRVILMATVLFFFRNGSSCPVRGRVWLSFLLTIPVTLLTGAAFISPAFQLLATESPMSKPSTASVKSLMKFRRRSSPSVASSKPSSCCLARIRRMCRSSRLCNAAGSFADLLRASSSSAGRRKLPTWSARNDAGILLTSSESASYRISGDVSLREAAEIQREPEHFRETRQEVFSIAQPNLRLLLSAICCGRSLYARVCHKFGTLEQQFWHEQPPTLLRLETGRRPLVPRFPQHGIPSLRGNGHQHLHVEGDRHAQEHLWNGIHVAESFRRRRLDTRCRCDSPLGYSPNVCDWFGADSRRGTLAIFRDDETLALSFRI